jgi:hypothetical protein
MIFSSYLLNHPELILKPPVLLGWVPLLGGTPSRIVLHLPAAV